MSKLATEYQGFLKYIKRANNQINSWFGPYCNYDPNRITFMAAREWNVMADDEKKHFIKSQTLTDHRGYNPNEENPYFCFLIKKHHLSITDLFRKNSLEDIDLKSIRKSAFNSNLAKSLGLEWKNLSQEEKNKYASYNLCDLAMDHVIEKRDKLHQLYDPKELAILEFIIKTKPKRPLQARSWYLTLDNYSIKSEEVIKKWQNISKEDKRFYEVCEELDRKRFRFDRNIWYTKMLTLDTSCVDFKLPEFKSIRALSDVETFSSIIGPNRNLIPPPTIKRPLNAFSLFLKDYREQNRMNTKQFVFGKHLKDSAAAWFKLSEKEKSCYFEASKKLKEAYREKMKQIEQMKLSNSNLEDPFEITNVLFKKPVTNDELYKPSQLIKQKKPNVVDVYGNANNIAKHLRKEAWNSLSPADKEPYILEYESLKTLRQKQKAELKEKMNHIKELIKKANKLRDLKYRIGLTFTRY